MTQQERFEAVCGQFPFCMPMHKHVDGSFRDAHTKHAWEVWKRACPEGFAAVPAKITAETVHKSALISEFFENVTMTCPECWGDEYLDQDCDICNGQGHYDQRVPVEWTTIKAIHDRVVSVSAPPKAPC